MMRKTRNSNHGQKGTKKTQKSFSFFNNEESKQSSEIPRVKVQNLTSSISRRASINDLIEKGQSQFRYEQIYDLKKSMKKQNKQFLKQQEKQDFCTFLYNLKEPSEKESEINLQDDKSNQSLDIIGEMEVIDQNSNKYQKTSKKDFKNLSNIIPSNYSNLVYHPKEDIKQEFNKNSLVQKMMKTSALTPQMKAQKKQIFKQTHQKKSRQYKMTLPGPQELIFKEFQQNPRGKQKRISIKPLRHWLHQHIDYYRKGCWVIKK